MNDFEYNRHFPLGIEEYGSSGMKDGTVRDISYSSTLGGKVAAYLVVPNEGGPFPAIVVVHPGQGDRTSFLSEAAAWASQGILSLLIDASFNRSRHSDPIAEHQKALHIAEAIANARTYIQTVADIRRGIDVLNGLGNVDMNRLMYVGHSFGATWGGVVAGVEDRLKAYVLMAGYSRVSEWHRNSGHPMARFIRDHLTKERLDRFISDLEPLDAVHYIPNASPARLFFQFAHHDELVSKDQANLYYDAASSPKEIAWYETGHLFSNCDEAFQDRMRWILRFFNVM